MQGGGLPCKGPLHRATRRLILQELQDSFIGPCLWSFCVFLCHIFLLVVLPCLFVVHFDPSVLVSLFNMCVSFLSAVLHLLVFQCWSVLGGHFVSPRVLHAAGRPCSGGRDLVRGPPRGRSLTSRWQRCEQCASRAAPPLRFMSS